MSDDLQAALPHCVHMQIWPERLVSKKPPPISKCVCRNKAVALAEAALLRAIYPDRNKVLIWIRPTTKPLTPRPPRLA
jgi:hypothetical protein